MVQLPPMKNDLCIKKIDKDDFFLKGRQERFKMYKFSQYLINYMRILFKKNIIDLNLKKKKKSESLF